MQISIIVAMAENRCIGKANELPWHLPRDLQYFKKVTMGKPVIMGRNTFESIGKPLPGRMNIVISSSAISAIDNNAFDNLYQVDSPEAAIALAQSRMAADSDQTANAAGEIFIIGGGQLYAACMPEVSQLYLTRIHRECDGDTFFPALEERDWSLISKEFHAADEKNDTAMSFEVWARTGAAV